MSFEHPHWLLYVGGEDEDPDAPPYRWRWIALVFISMAIVLIGVDITVTGVATPALSKELHANMRDIQWVFAGFTLALAGFVLLGGGIADRFGRKGTFQAGMAIVILGSCVAAFATTPPVLILGRVITGFGAALVMPPALSMLTVIFKADERPTAIAIWSGLAAIGIALGPVIGGVLLRSYWFGSVFLVNVPVAIVAMVGAAFTIPTSRRPGSDPLDILGAVLSVIALTGLVAAIIEGPELGFNDPIVLAAFVIGVAATAGFIIWELRNPHPLLDLRIYKVPEVVAGSLLLALVFLTFNGTYELLMPQYLQYVESYSVFTTGLVMLPVGIVFGVVSLVAPRIVRRLGVRQTFIVGLIVMIVGLGLNALLAMWGGYANVLVGMVVFMIAVGLLTAPSTTAIMTSLPVAKAGDGSATNQISRQIGAAFGAAIGGSTFAAIFRNRLEAYDPAVGSLKVQTTLHSVGNAIEAAEALPEPAQQTLIDAAREAASVATSWAFVVDVALTLVVLAVVLRLMKPRSDLDSDTPSERAQDEAAMPSGDRRATS